MLRKLFLIFIFFDVNADLRSLSSNLVSLNNASSKFETKLIFKKDIKVSGINSVDITDKYVAIGSEIGRLKVWDLQADSSPFFTSRASLYKITVKIFPNNKFVLSGSHEGNIEMWDILTRERLHKINLYPDAITSLSISNNSKLILASGWDHIVKLWDIQSRRIYSLEHASFSVSSAVFSSDIRYIVSSETDGTISIWNFMTLKKIQEFKKNLSFRNVAISNNNKYIVANSPDSIKIWSQSTKNKWKDYKQFPIENYGFVISNDNKHIIVAIWNAVEIINIETEKTVQRIPIDDVLIAIAISNNGKHIAVATDAGLKIYEWADKE